MLNNIKAAIFDMDGTLIDSMWIWEKVDIEYLAKRNLSIPEDLRENIEHLSFIETAKYFKDRFHLPDSIEEIMKEWNDTALYEYMHNVTLKPGVDKYLSYLKSLDLKIGLATSNSTVLLKIALEKTNILQYFDVISTTDEVSRGKNFPDIYLLCAHRLGIEPKDCIVFEDILPAVLGAKSAGMRVVGVYDAFSENQKEEISENADHYILEYDSLVV